MSHSSKTMNMVLYSRLALRQSVNIAGVESCFFARDNTRETNNSTQVDDYVPYEMDCNHRRRQDTRICNTRVQCGQKIVTHSCLITTRVCTLPPLWQQYCYVGVTCYPAEPIRAWILSSTKTKREMGKWSRDRILHARVLFLTQQSTKEKCALFVTQE